MININIQTDNAAFDEGNRGYEIARILRKLADRFEQEENPTSARDINGNKVVSIDYED